MNSKTLAQSQDEALIEAIRAEPTPVGEVEEKKARKKPGPKPKVRGQEQLVIPVPPPERLMPPLPKALIPDAYLVSAIQEMQYLRDVILNRIEDPEYRLTQAAYTCGSVIQTLQIILWNNNQLENTEGR